jgi:hypothetical protein
MYRIQRKTLAHLLSALLLIGAFALVYFGVPPLVPFRTEPHWPYVSLVSVEPGVAPDIWSSVPVLLHLFLAALQCILLVEVARLIWIASNTMRVHRYLVTLVYEVALAIDIFRLWGQDWFVWISYQLKLGQLCSLPSSCYPFSGAFPWISLSALIIVLTTLMLGRLQSTSSASAPRISPAS